MANSDHERRIQSGPGIGSAGAGGGPYAGIGAQLREARERAGYDIADVERTLRIRLAHLEAIEEGRFTELPGPVYASGFVRSYGEFLGFDGAAVARLFREEAEDLRAETKLVFPSPTREGTLPRAALIFFSLAVAAAVYSVWNYVSGRERIAIEAISEVPERLAVVALEEPASAAAALAEAGEVQAAGAAEARNEPPADGQVAKAQPEPIVPSPPETEESAAASASGEPSEAAAAAPVEIEVSALPEPPPREPPPQPQVVLKPPPPYLILEEPIAAEPPPAPSAPEPAPRASEPASGRYVPQVYGAANADARVVLRAQMDSWVQIRGRNNELVLTRMLRAGDVYQVPNRSDLIMMTGNAGGLEITVDGEPIPPVGPVGEVRRDISLDAERLLAIASANR